MRLGFERNQMAVAASAANHASVLPAIQRLRAHGFEVLLVGMGAEALATAWADRGVLVEVKPEESVSPAIAVAGPGQDPHWMAQSPHRLSLGVAALAGGQMIGNLEEWVDAYLAPRVPRLF